MIIKENGIDKDGDTYYLAYLELFPDIKFEGYDIDQVRMFLEESISRSMVSREIDLASFPDFIPEKFELECGVYKESELKDDDLYKFKTQII